MRQIVDNAPSFSRQLAPSSASVSRNSAKRREIITIVDKAEYQKLMSYMNREDPQAFITVYTVSDMRYQPKE